jgi:hypothetical protein
VPELPLDSGDAALPGAAALAAVMRLEAPARMTLQGVYDLVQACDVLLAEEVITHIPVYAQTALMSAPILEVR